MVNLLLLGFQGSKPAATEVGTAAREVIEDDPLPTIYLFKELMENRDLMSGNRQCFSLGPFHSSEDMEAVRERLMQVSVAINERQTQALVEKGYWVYLTPYQTLQEASNVLLSLRAMGLEDIALIPEGIWSNSISLGLFLRQENALKRKQDLEERGFSPLIEVQRQTESRYWLDYEQDPGSRLIDLGLQNLPNDFMQRALPCLEPETAPEAQTDPEPGTEKV